jgi:LacI family transcriptional regulator
MLSAATVARVQQAARDLRYTANSFARGLRTDRSLTVGVLVPDLMNPLFPPIVRGVQEALFPHGYTALIANTDNDPQRELAHFDALLSRQVDGFIVATARQSDAIIEKAQRVGAAVVLVNRSSAAPGFPLVTSDDRSGIRAAVEHLTELGHTRIGHLAGPAGVSTAEVRSSAFREVSQSLGLRLADTPVVGCEAFTEDGGTSGAHTLLTAHPDVTAIVAANDLIALGCLRALARAGLRCPADVSVTGYNDMRFADAFSPALTTVRVPHTLMGAEAASLLLDKISDPASVNKTLLLPVELIVRDSTAVPRTLTELRSG